MNDPERHPDLEDDEVLWFTLPQWAFWFGIFSVAGIAYYLLH